MGHSSRDKLQIDCKWVLLYEALRVVAGVLDLSVMRIAVNFFGDVQLKEQTSRLPKSASREDYGCVLEPPSAFVFHSEFGSG